MYSEHLSYAIFSSASKFSPQLSEETDEVNKRKIREDICSELRNVETSELVVFVAFVSNPSVFAGNVCYRAFLPYVKDELNARLPARR